MSARRKLPALAVALMLAQLPFASAQLVALRKMGPELQVNVRAEISGQIQAGVLLGVRGLVQRNGDLAQLVDGGIDRLGARGQQSTQIPPGNLAADRHLGVG